MSTRPGPCRQAADLWAYLAGELTAARCRALARHVEACDACAREARNLRALLQACRAAGGQRLPPEVRARAKARVRTLRKTGRL